MRNWQEVIGGLSQYAAEIHVWSLDQRSDLLHQMLVKPDATRLNLMKKVRLIDAFSRTFVEPGGSGYRFEPVFNGTTSEVSFVPVEIIGVKPELFRLSYKDRSQLVRYYYVRRNSPSDSVGWANIDLDHVIVWERNVRNELDSYAIIGNKFLRHFQPSNLYIPLLLRDWTDEPFSKSEAEKRLYEQTKLHEFTHHAWAFVVSENKLHVARYERNGLEYATYLSEIAQSQLPWESFVTSVWYAHAYFNGERSSHAEGGYRVVRNLASIFSNHDQVLSGGNINYFVKLIGEYWSTQELKEAATSLYQKDTRFSPLPLEWIRMENREVPIELDFAQLEVF